MQSHCEESRGTIRRGRRVPSRMILGGLLQIARSSNQLNDLHQIALRQATAQDAMQGCISMQGLGHSFMHDFMRQSLAA